MDSEQKPKADASRVELQKEVKPAAIVYPIEKPAVQRALADRWCEVQKINMSGLDACATAWVEGGDRSMASRYRQYAARNADVQVDINDKEELRLLLEQIEKAIIVR